MPSDNRKGKEIKDITDRWMYAIVMDVRAGVGLDGTNKAETIINKERKKTHIKMMEGNRLGGTKERAEAFNVLDGQYVYTYRLAAGSKAQDEPQPTPQQASKQKMEHEPPKEIKKDVGFFLIRKGGQ